jgi:mannan endo-1,4-beta-mannosidase
VGELPKAEILEVQPKWLWFLVWSNWLWTDNPRERVQEVYNRPQTLTHDELKKLQ